MVSTRSGLLQAAQSFCDTFAQQKPPADILVHFSETHQCVVLEHGLPKLGPFLGKPFLGRQGVAEYLDVVKEHLSYEDMKFSEFTVDAEALKVCVKGTARFTANKTGQGWDETFIYMLNFDSEGKVTDWKIWADSGALFLAIHGNLVD